MRVQLNTFLSACFITACGFDSAGCFQEPMEVEGSGGASEDAGDESSSSGVLDSAEEGDDSSSDTGEDDGTSGETGEEICTSMFVRTLGVETSYLTAHVDDSDPLQLEDTNLTVEMWGRIPKSNSDAGLYVGIMRATPLLGWSFGASHVGEIKATVAGRFNHFAGADIVDGEWHHFAWSYDRQTSKIFVDGVMVGYEEHTSSVDAAENNLYVGLSAAFGEARAGDVSSIRISDVARYEDDFEPAVELNVDGDTVSAWSFVSGEGSSVEDSNGGPSMAIYGSEWGVEETHCD